MTSANIIGAGTMGTGIAQVCATSGLFVLLIDVDEARVARGREAVSDGIEQMHRRGKLSAAQRDAALERVRVVVDYAALNSCDFIIEAANEDEALKLKILRHVEMVATHDAIIATNTSSISVTKLSSAIKRAVRFVGLHFFNPVPHMALVEVVRGRQTDVATVEAARGLAMRLGKKPVVVKDSPGFIVNRLLCPMLNEAVSVYAAGIAAAHDIDKAMKLGCNHPVGPLALADLIGLDVLLAVMEVFQRDFDDSKYRPAPMLKEMVAAGCLGRKSGRGFYTYETSK